MRFRVVYLCADVFIFRYPPKRPRLFICFFSSLLFVFIFLSNYTLLGVFSCLLAGIVVLLCMVIPVSFLLKPFLPNDVVGESTIIGRYVSFFLLLSICCITPMRVHLMTGWSILHRGRSGARAVAQSMVSSTQRSQPNGSWRWVQAYFRLCGASNWDGIEHKQPTIESSLLQISLRDSFCEISALTGDRASLWTKIYMRNGIAPESSEDAGLTTTSGNFS